MNSSIFPTVDVDRMIKALSTNASDFGLDGAWLQHRPTRHRFRFAEDGRLTLVMSHGVFFVWVSREQKAKLTEAFTIWKNTYWCLRIRARTTVRRCNTEQNVNQRESVIVLAILFFAVLFLMAEHQVLESLRHGPTTMAASPIEPLSRGAGH